MKNEVAASSDLSLRHLARILYQRRWTILRTVCICVALSILALLLSTKRYKATALVQLQKADSDSLNLNSMTGSSASINDALSTTIDLQTQVQILESDEILLRVINQEKLEDNPDFKPRGLIQRIFGGSQVSSKEPATVPLRDSARRREQMLALFRAREKVEIVSGTRIISVSFLNQDPQVAAAVANDLVRELSEQAFAVKHKATGDASRLLEGQLSDLRKQSTDLQAKVSELQKQTGLYGVGGVDPQGKPIVYSPALDRFQQTNSALMQAESNALIKGAIAGVAKTRDADQISQLSGTGLMSSAAAGVQTSLQLIENLRGQESTIQQQIGKDEAIFGDAYPRLIEEHAALAKVQGSLREEVSRIAQRANNDYDIALQTQKGIADRFEQDKAQARNLNDRTIEYTLLSKEADQSQLLYNDLLHHMREADVLEGLRQSNLTTVSMAFPSATPQTPNARIYLGAGLLLGLLLGLGAAFLVDAMDDNVRGSEDIESEGIPLIGFLPLFTGQGSRSKLESLPSTQKLQAKFLAEPMSQYSEAVRALRSHLMAGRGPTPPQVIVISSAIPGEGKTTTALNLAVALALLKREVLLVDFDFRQPDLSQRLGLQSREGMSRLLMEPESPIAYETFNEQPYLKVIPAGPTSAFAGELLSSSRLDELVAEWRRHFQYIVFDTPSMLRVADVQLLIAKADVSLMVIRSNYSTRASFKRVFQILQDQQTGTGSYHAAILNALPLRSAHYSGYRSDDQRRERVADVARA